MRAGLLTQKVQVMHAVLTRGKTGAGKATWSNLFGEGKSLNARVTYGKQQMQAKNGNYVLTSDITFCIRYYAMITEYDRVLWEGRKYGITAIRRYPERGEMQLDCQLLDE